MAGLLDTDELQELFGDVLSDIYGDGILQRMTMGKTEPGGSIKPMPDGAPETVKVQTDSLTEAMRSSDRYTNADVVIYMLQSGVSGRKPKTDDRITIGTDVYLIDNVTQDPTRS